MAKKASETPVEAKEVKAAKKGLTYTQRLEARAQRGEMTHQKKLAIKTAKKRDMKGV